VPTSAYGVLLTFVASAVVIGFAMAWLTGQRRVRATILPIAAALLVLSLVGHTLKLDVGPTVNLFGFDVHLWFDLAVAAAASLAVAVLQRWVLAERSSRTRTGSPKT
jgi:hypothetical protein